MLRHMDTSGDIITNGVKRLGLRHYALIVNGQNVCDFHGTYWAAWQEWGVYAEAMRNDTEVAEMIDRPIEEIPNKYWKNGHIAPLRIK